MDHEWFDRTERTRPSLPRLRRISQIITVKTIQSMTPPLVSVAICMRNGGRYIEATLRSVFEQTLQDFEIILIDDGSTDDGADFVEAEFRDPRLTVVRQPPQTLRVARPAAVAHSRGEFLAFLDHDDIWLPTKLAHRLDVARAAPDAALIFSDCFIINATGGTIGRFSDGRNLRAIDLSRENAHLELLRYGCFITYSTAFVRAGAFRAVGGFNHSYQYVSDYDLWLRLARRYELRCVYEPLAKYRVHPTQFTQRHPDITLSEHRALLNPLFRSASYPRDVHIAIGDILLGQHRVACRVLFQDRRFRAAARAAAGMWSYPDRILDSLRHHLATCFPALEKNVASFLRAKAQVVNAGRRILLGARRAPKRLWRILRWHESLIRSIVSAATPPATSPRSVWIDGTSLGAAQTGYFSLLSELIRRLVRDPRYRVHVATNRRGRTSLATRLGSDAESIRFHRVGWRALHWPDIHQLACGWRAHLLIAILWMFFVVIGIAGIGAYAVLPAVSIMGLQAVALVDALSSDVRGAMGVPTLSYSARLVRFLWRRVPRPRGRSGAADVTEVVFWRGRFRWRDSHRIAVLQDLTTRIHPELHTPTNVSEFDEFLGYVQRHAHTIATISTQSRRDIIERIGVCPQSVRMLTMPVHPVYTEPRFNKGVSRWYGISTPYILCVGTIEPRKNLRRLVTAFELLKHESSAADMPLVLAGPPGWDGEFRQWLVSSDAWTRVRMLGFVPLEHMPSLYHFASAVICPSVYEGFGLPVLEAMCCSGVALASRVSALSEVLGADGIQFDPYSTEDMARALLHALTLPPAEETTYRRRCRARAEAHLRQLADEDPLPCRFAGSNSPHADHVRSAVR